MKLFVQMALMALFVLLVEVRGGEHEDACNSLCSKTSFEAKNHKRLEEKYVTVAPKGIQTIHGSALFLTVWGNRKLNSSWHNFEFSLISWSFPKKLFVINACK